VYPLNLTNSAIGGYAVANDENEHKALTAFGYSPAFVGEVQSAPEAEPTLESVRAELDSRGVAYDKRWGLKKLQELL